jgi:hypothetical protein
VGTRNYQILDVGLRIESSHETFLEAFHQDYRRFEVTTFPEGRGLSVRFEGNLPGEDAFLEVDGVREDLKGHPHPDRHVTQAIAQLLMERAQAFTILHAAVLGMDGNALAISGPSGAGKTTLTLALLESGCSYLSDDFCPLHHDTGLVHPFPRSLWVRSEPGQESRNQRRGKILFPLDDRAFPIERHPLRLNWLICLEVGTAEKSMGKLRVALREGLEASFLDQFQGLQGIEIQKVDASMEWLIQYPREGNFTRRIKELLHQHRDAIWNVYSLPDVHPDFSVEPVMARIPSHEAAFFLLRELKHSLMEERPHSRALKPGVLMSHLGSLLSGVICFRLSPGPLDQRLNLIQKALNPEGSK